MASQTLKKGIIMNDAEKIRFVLLKSKFERNKKARKTFFGGGLLGAFRKKVGAQMSIFANSHLKHTSEDRLTSIPERSNDAF